MVKKRFSLTKTCLFFHICGNKGCEIEWLYVKDWEAYFSLITAWTRRTDHAGIQLHLELCCLAFYLTIYDYRHWDYEKKTWFIHETP